MDRIDRRIFKEGLSLLKDNNVRFAVVKLISCNGAESNSFTDARCGFEVLQDKNKVPSFIPFTVMFEKGVSFLEEFANRPNEGKDLEKLQDTTKEALLCLDNFYKTKGKNETSLKIVLDKMQDGRSSVTGTDITLSLAEHLLGKLAPGESYELNSKTKGKIESCKCGCKKEPTFYFTGIGHELVWHGFVDIVFLSHRGIQAIASTVMEKEETTPQKRKLEKEDERKNDGSQDGRTVTDIQQELPEHSLGKALAETIVFSLEPIYSHGTTHCDFS